MNKKRLVSPEISKGTTDEERSEQARKAGSASHRPLNRRKTAAGPCTSDRMIYSSDEEEFILAVHAWQNRTGRRFPLFSEVLAILKSLGYQKGKNT